MVTETMDSCMLGERLLQTLQYAWQNLLKPSGVVIPHGGNLWFRLVQSGVLARKYMFPLDSVIAEDCVNAFANISLKNSAEENFQPLNFPNLFVELDEPYDTERLQMLPDCTFLTEPYPSPYVDFNCPEQIEECLRCENRFSFVVTCTVGGYFHAIAAWFSVNVDEEFVLCSSPDNPHSKNCCWDQAVFPCHRAYPVVPGCRISITSDWIEGRVGFLVQQITYPDGSTRSMQTDAIKVPTSFVSMLNDSNLLDHLRTSAVKFLEGFKGEEELHILDTFPVPVFGLTVLRNIHLINRSLKKIRLVFIVESEDAAEVISKMAEYNAIPLEYVSFLLEDDLDVQLSQFTSAFFDAVILDLLDKEGDLKESIIGCIRLLK